MREKSISKKNFEDSTWGEKNLEFRVLLISPNPVGLFQILKFRIFKIFTIKNFLQKIFSYLSSEKCLKKKS